MHEIEFEQGDLVETDVEQGAALVVAPATALSLGDYEVLESRRSRVAGRSRWSVRYKVKTVITVGNVGIYPDVPDMSPGAVVMCYLAAVLDTKADYSATVASVALVVRDDGAGRYLSRPSATSGVLNASFFNTAEECAGTVVHCVFVEV